MFFRTYLSSYFELRIFLWAPVTARPILGMNGRAVAALRSVRYEPSAPALLDGTARMLTPASKSLFAAEDSPTDSLERASPAGYSLSLSFNQFVQRVQVGSL